MSKPCEGDPDELTTEFRGPLSAALNERDGAFIYASLETKPRNITALLYEFSSEESKYPRFITLHWSRPNH